MTQQSPGDLLSSLAQILVAMGGGGALLKLIEHLFKAKDKGADDATAFRRELREEVRSLQARADELERRLDEQRERNAVLFTEKEALRSENHHIRSENHQLRGFLAQLVLHAQMLHKRAGLPEADLPRIPAWLIESTPGPTTGDKPTAEGAK